MKNKTSLFACLAFCLLSGLISSCSSGGNNSTQNLHTTCQGFSLTCQHGGTCGESNLGNNQYRDTCTCPAGYEGTYCETLSKTKYLGTYVGIMSQEYPGATKAATFPDTVTILANTDDTTVTVCHIYVFMNATPYVPAYYDTIICEASYGWLEGPRGSDIDASFTDATNTKLHFECYSNGIGGLSDSWFNGTKQ